MMTLGEKLAHLRKENNLTQEQFAEMLKVSRQSVSKWELGAVYPDTEKLIRIGKIFNCSLDYLLKDEIESMDINATAANEAAKEDKMKGYFLTYLSFPPLFGFIVAVFSLRHQYKNVHNKTCMILSIIGMMVSLALTVTMIIGFAFGL